MDAHRRRGGLVGMLMVAGASASVQATELLPGQTLLVADLSAGTATGEVYGAGSLTSSGWIQYSLPPRGLNPVFGDSGVLNSWESQTAGGRAELVYEFDAPYAEGPPPPPGLPYSIARPLGTTDTVSISGFGSGTIDVSKVANLLAGTVVSVGYIQRSVTGDVVTFGDFGSDLSLAPGGSDWFTFVVPDEQLGYRSATASVTDVNGDSRTIVVDAVGPVPEPGSLMLLALGVAGLGLRAGRRRG